MEFGDIQEILFTLTWTDYDQEKKRAFLESNKDLSELTDEKLRTAFSDFSAKNNWERFFKDKTNNSFDIESAIDSIRAYRNDVAHCKFVSNEEYNIGKEVYHIHGQFDKKSDVYVESSLRNQLPDAPLRDTVIDENYFYLYSNALTTHCGEYKEFQINQHSQANSCVEKMALAYKTNPEKKKEIDGWTKDKNTLTANLGYAIQLKVANPKLAFSDNYHFDKLKSITGSIEILGLSPWNDFHVFESINSASLEECVYYYFNDSECDEIRALLPKLESDNILKMKSVKDFWREMYED